MDKVILEFKVVRHIPLLNLGLGGTALDAAFVPA